MRQSKHYLSALLSSLILLLGLISVSAQTQPVFRIGILDAPEGDLARGAQLAVQEINAAGGVLGADGTAFQLELVIQPTDDLDFAIANINQASVIAVIGPADSETALSNRTSLARLNVPILTTARDDTLIANDTSDLMLRISAQEALLGRALANYLITDLRAASLVTVQLDLESTVSVLGFSRAATQQGLSSKFDYVFSEDVTIPQIVDNIATSTMPQFVVAYGRPEIAAEFYARLRESGYPGRFVFADADSPVFRDHFEAAELGGVIGVSTWSYTNGDDASNAFTLAYLRAFGEAPTALSASAYDGISLLQEAIKKPGNLQDNLLTIRNFRGIQGNLSPALLVPGETSMNVVVYQLGEFGAPAAVARYEGIQRLALPNAPSPILVISNSPTPRPTSTPAPTLTPFPTATPDGVFITITRSVQNVRVGPGLNYDILGQLTDGETARVVGALANFTWVAINFRGTIGWLSADILDITGNLNTVPVLTPPPPPTPLPATLTPTAAPIPDIVISAASPNRLTIGVPFTVNATVSNQGSVAAGPFAVAAAFQPGNVFSAVNLQGLGGSSQVIISLTGTLTGATGPQDVTIVADLNNQVNEGTGEANNSAFILRYIADAPLLTTAQAAGTLTLTELGTTSLDGGTQDIQWGGGGLVPLGATQLGILTGFNSFEAVHRDAIFNATKQNVAINPVTNGMMIAVRTDGGQKYGVIQVVQAVGGSQVTFNYRMYDN